MKKFFCFLLLSLFVSSCSEESAGSSTLALSRYNFLSFGGFNSRTTNNNSSGILIKNTSASSINVKAVYITALDVGSAYPTCFGGIVAGMNLMGAMWTPINVDSGEEITIDKNFLYNLMTNYIFQVKNVVGSVPSNLPGGTAPGDTENSWCIHLGLSTSDAQPQSIADPAPLIVDAFSGSPSEVALITCNDTTLSCTSNTQNIQNFPR